MDTPPITATVEEHWNFFAYKIMPEAAPPIQRKEMKRAFFCGFMRCMTLIQEASELLDEEDACRLLGGWSAEVIAFANAVAEDRD